MDDHSPNPLVGHGEKTVLVTGAAGFIGSQVAKMLLEDGATVVGIDSLNEYYDVRLKRWRLEQLNQFERFKFVQGNIEDPLLVASLFEANNFDIVFNLAARAGVRASLVIPDVYMATNADGALNLLQAIKNSNCRQFVLASTSSLYAGQQLPFSEDKLVNRPLSPYAASKLAAEAMSYTYHHLYGINVAVLRYFTVYGPAARPDMSVLRFIQKIDQQKPFPLYGDGSHTRDFTYVDDIARGTIAASRIKGYEIINLGGGIRPYAVSELIKKIEQALGKKAVIEYHDENPADMKSTWANAEKAQSLLDWQPAIDLDEGIQKSVAWYLENHDWTSQLSMAEKIDA